MYDRLTAMYILAVLCLFGLTGPASSSVRYVKWDSSGNGSGNTWTDSFHSITAAINDAVSGDEIWVAGDADNPYRECITLTSGVALYGGFDGSEIARNQRNWLTNKTIIDGNQDGTVITIPSSADSATRVDGFTIQNGGETDTNTGSGVYCLYASSPVIAHNTITSNNAGGGGGIYCSGAFPTIINNLIIDNNADEGGGIYCTNYSSPVVANNNIIWNASSCSGGAIYNFASSPAISNNIVAYNSSGIYSYGGSPVLHNNDFYLNFSSNYDGISAGDDDVSFAPMLTDNYHIKSFSPCVDAGITVAIVSDDIDGQGRYSGTTVDIGMDEYWETADVKSASDGADVMLNGVVVTASLNDCYYVETTDRIMGVRVGKPTSNDDLSPSWLVNVTGKCQTNADGERCITSAAINQIRYGYQLKPLGVNNHNIGNGPLGYQGGVYGWIIILDAEKKPHRVWGPKSGLNNIGLLIKTWGKVTNKEQGTTTTWFTIDDGSDLDIKCICSSGVSVNVGESVRVTGVVSCEKVGDELRPVIRLRGSYDLAGVGD